MRRATMAFLFGGAVTLVAALLSAAPAERKLVVHFDELRDGTFGPEERLMVSSGSCRHHLRAHTNDSVESPLGSGNFINGPEGEAACDLP